MGQRQTKVKRLEHQVEMLTIDLQAVKQDRDKRLEQCAQEIDYERLQRVAAQRGLVAYMVEHGLRDRIGYDPDQDPRIIALIQEGRVPPKNEIAALATAG